MIAGSLTGRSFGSEDARRLASLIRLPSTYKQTLEVRDAALLVGARRDLALPADTRPDGWQVILAGQLHNRRQLATDLGLSAQSSAETVYAAALDRWCEEADERCIGHYAAIALAPDRSAFRLARSPFQAPPLHFRISAGVATVAQHPRVLYWRDQGRPEPDLARVAQSLINDSSERFRSWYMGAQRIPLGCAVKLEPDSWREVWRYDLFARPAVKLASPADYVAAARALLDEGVAAALEDARQPAVQLSGGLDSPLVAASALRQLPEPKKLHSFTFGPLDTWQTSAPKGMFLNDFAAVRKFAELHPRLACHYETNPGRDFRHLQRELLEATDGSPSMLGLAWIEHELYARARAEGCDVMLVGTWGNLTFSSRGPWGYSEYLLRGRWGGLLAALRDRPDDPRPLWRRFASLAVMPLLPRPLWQWARRFSHHEAPGLGQYGINPGWAQLEPTLRRSRAAGFDFERLQHASKRDYWRAILAEDGQDQDQYALGLELIHGVAKRDPTAYRPLVEFCWGCPTEVFLKGGIDRWLAREMARGVMPEAQRLNRDYGQQYVDWQPRLAAARDDLIAELDRMADDPDIAAIVDLPRLKSLLEHLPASQERYDPRVSLPYRTALPLGMAAGRFIAYAKGRNDI